MMQVEKIEEILFYFAYLLLFAFSALGHIPMIGGYLNKLTNIALVILAFLILLKNKVLSTRDIAILCLLAIFSFALIVSANYYGLLKLTLIMAATKGMNFKKILKYDISIRLIFMLAVFFLCYIGIAPDVTSHYGSGNIRHSWGFQNSNHIGLTLTIVVFELLYIWDMQLKISRISVILGISWFSTKISGSRTAELIIIMSLMLAVAYTIRMEAFRHKWVKNAIGSCAVVFSLFTKIAASLYTHGNAMAHIVDKITSGRIRNVVYYDQLFNVTLFGNDLSVGNRTLDSLYAYIWMGLGIVTFIFFCIAYAKLIDAAYKKNDIPMMIIMFCFAVYGISERLWMAIDYNIMMIAFRELLYGDIIVEGERQGRRLLL